MKKRYTDEQIAYALKRNETGTKVGEICREMGVSEASFYKWKAKYAGIFLYFAAFGPIPTVYPEILSLYIAVE